MADETPRQIVFVAHKAISRETAANVPAFTTQTKRQFTESGNKIVHKSVSPRRRRRFEIPEILQMARCGENFVYYDSRPQEERIIVSATLPAIDLLKQSDDSFCDVTLSTAQFFIRSTQFTLRLTVSTLLWCILFFLIKNN